jgi:hypothetical protein
VLHHLEHTAVRKSSCSEWSDLSWCERKHNAKLLELGSSCTNSNVSREPVGCLKTVYVLTIGLLPVWVLFLLARLARRRLFEGAGAAWGYSMGTRPILLGDRGPCRGLRRGVRLALAMMVLLGGLQPSSPRVLLRRPPFTGLVRMRGGADPLGKTQGGPPPAVPRLLDCVSISKNGTATRRQIRKSELASELSCPTRDLRLIDASFPGNYAAFLARRTGIVLCVERVKAVIKRNEVLLFDPNSKDVMPLVPMLQQQLTSNHHLPTTPFEHLVLETILGNVCHMVHDRLQQLSPHIFKILGDLKFRHGTLSSFGKLLDELLPMRNELSELHYTVQVGTEPCRPRGY